jgi:MFS family permease
VGLLMAAGGLVMYTRLPVDGHYFWDLFPAFLLGGIGMALAFVPMSIGALSGIGREDAGVASGLLNTSQQIGGAVGVAVATTIATTYSAHYAASHGGSSGGAALVHGFQITFLVLAVVALVASLLAALLAESRTARPATETGEQFGELTPAIEEAA